LPLPFLDPLPWVAPGSGGKGGSPWAADARSWLVVWVNESPRDFTTWLACSLSCLALVARVASGLNGPLGI